MPPGTPTSHPKRPASEAFGFAVRHWPHVLLSPLLGFTWVTFLHEGAHAAAAVLQGGTVTELSIVPQPGSFGHMQYHFPPGAFASHALVSLAPYLMWAALAGLTSGVALFRPRLPHWLASTAYLWAFVVPLLDIANAAAGYLFGGPGDLKSALGPPDLLWAVALVGAAFVAFVVGFEVQRRLYRDRAVSLAAYVLLAGCGAGLVAVALWAIGPFEGEIARLMRLAGA